MESKVLSGRLELEIIQNSSGEYVYVVELANKSGESLYRQLEDFLDENVKIIIEVVGRL